MAFNDINVTVQGEKVSSKNPVISINATYRSLEDDNTDIYSEYGKGEHNPTKRTAEDSKTEEKEIEDATTVSTRVKKKSTSSGMVLDDLEFLHDFLEHQSKRNWFESNCFEFCFTIQNTYCMCVICMFVYIAHKLQKKKKKKQNQIKQNQVSIPIICMIFTYGHIALALWMTFNPTEFIGLYQFQSGPLKGYGFGWQGIVPMKAIKMAEMAVDLMIPNVIRMEDIIHRINPNEVAVIMEPACYKVLQIIIPRVAQSQAPMAWALLPEHLRKSFIDIAVRDAPITVKNMIEDISKNIESVFDLKDMVGTALQNDKKLLSNVFLKCGWKELIFIRKFNKTKKMDRNFGAVLGLVLGFGQMIATISFGHNKLVKYWMLPVSGFILGWITNWIALQIIFRPVLPHRFCGITIHGLFLRRQREVSVEFASFLTKTVLRAEVLFSSMLRGKSSDRLFDLVIRHFEDACERFADFGRIKPLLEYAVGPEKFQRIKKEACDELLKCHQEMECQEDIMIVQKKLENYADEVMDLERLIREQMSKLSYQQFEGCLHPVFKEDEIKLIAIGAILGLLVGFFQVYVIRN
ncbi:hypothetical protein RFI_14864 [Reticulomyxa filosa]|uniref:DUF445 domain-containing protein n=1 Tax=Reticulomyxa filosa TaxID=46433 RepID=X6N8W3_RETFI|nr:hypothetical protein RFI_14864 [Reticulomyxa filosa]|eukprot:ETO22338.1 hypothetical protein RFI_14864 [Reticulomyxa filosa]